MRHAGDSRETGAPEGGATAAEGLQGRPSNRRAEAHQWFLKSNRGYRAGDPLRPGTQRSSGEYGRVGPSRASQEVVVILPRGAPRKVIQPESNQRWCFFAGRIAFLLGRLEEEERPPLAESFWSASREEVRIGIRRGSSMGDVGYVLVYDK